MTMETRIEDVFPIKNDGFSVDMFVFRGCFPMNCQVGDLQPIPRNAPCVSQRLTGKLEETFPKLLALDWLLKSWKMVYVDIYIYTVCIHWCMHYIYII